MKFGMNLSLWPDDSQDDMRPILVKDINPATHYVIPAAAERRAGIQLTFQFYWIPAFAGMTGG